jgi:hypothetical protein
MTTVLDGLGLPLPRRLEGQALGGVTHPVVCELYRNPGNIKLWDTRFDRGLRAVYSGPFKLILSSRENDADADLFDPSTDPGEAENLIQAKPERAGKLMSLIELWERSLGPALPPRRIEFIDLQTEKQLKGMGYGH